jgi:hypothetical protein
MPTDAHMGRVGGISAIIGVIVLFIATMMHPMNASPHDAPAAFAEYALDVCWVATHLGQLLGVVLIATGFVALSWKLRAGYAGAWALLAGLSTVASVSLAGALQAVDGVALKFAVDRWSASAEGARAAAFEAAYAVRQVEVGLASVTSALFGLTVLLYGIAIMLSPVAPKWLGVFGTLSGMATVISSVIQAHAGFSDLAMAASMPSSLLVLGWSMCAGIFLLRTSSAVDNAA